MRAIASAESAHSLPSAVRPSPINLKGRRPRGPRTVSRSKEPDSDLSPYPICIYSGPPAPSQVGWRAENEIALVIPQVRRYPARESGGPGAHRRHRERRRRPARPSRAVPCGRGQFWSSGPQPTRDAFPRRSTLSSLFACRLRSSGRRHTGLIVRRWEGSDNSPPARAATATWRSPG